MERGLTKRWIVPEHREPGTDLLARVLAARGLSDPTSAQAFMEPSLLGLHDPGLLPNVDKAAERLLGALEAGETVVIYGDYDVDGVTATAILYHTLTTIRPDADVRTYVPHRLEEGYGLNAEAMRTLADEGAAVIVSVDCGITAIEPARAAKDAGVDLIITDHHNPPAEGDELPDAYALVHPRLPGSKYPFGELCGAGVAYKLAWRTATLFCGGERVTPTLRTLLVELLGPCALGVIADVVPLVDENRVIARFGLGRVRTSPIEGLRALVEASGLADEKIDADAVGFRLGPRLNACGRLGHAREAVELFTTATCARASEISQALCTLNDERRATERRIFDEACKLAEGAGMTEAGTRGIVLAGDGWHPGVVGIVCSRLVERYGRPTILLCRESETCKGSGRSIDGYNLHAGIDACREHLTTFGGHDMAAGLSLASDRAEDFAAAFIAHANEHLRDEDLLPALRCDTAAELGELTPASVRTLEALAPFWRENPRAQLAIRGVRLADDPKPFGQHGRHAGLTLACARTGATVRCVGWNWSRPLREAGPAIKRGSTIDVVVTPRVSSWNGRVEPELCDLRVRSDAHSVVEGAVVERTSPISAMSSSMR